jgi:hypothetical protein
MHLLFASSGDFFVKGLSLLLQSLWSLSQVATSALSLQEVLTRCKKKNSHFALQEELALLQEEPAELIRCWKKNSFHCWKNSLRCKKKNSFAARKKNSLCCRKNSLAPRRRKTTCSSCYVGSFQKDETRCTLEGTELLSWRSDHPQTYPLKHSLSSGERR